MWQRLFQYDPVIGWLKMPNKQFRLNFADGVFRYRTNAAGFRSDEEFTQRKPPGTKRILAFGDSFAEGACVNEGERFTELLRGRLGVEIYNFALSGTGTDQQYLIYREIAAAYDHDLLLVAPWVENIRRNSASSRLHGDEDGNHFLTPKPYFALQEDGTLQLRNQPVPRPIPADEATESQMNGVDTGTEARRGLGGRAGAALTRLGPTPKRLAQRITRAQPLPEYDEPEGLPWRLTRSILDHWASESDAPMIIMPIPVYQYVERTASSEAVRARFAELHNPPDVYVHDLLPDMWSYPTAERTEFRFPRDHHLTPRGHSVVADSLEPVLARVLST